MAARHCSAEDVSKILVNDNPSDVFPFEFVLLFAISCNCGAYRTSLDIQISIYATLLNVYTNVISIILIDLEL